MDTPPDGWMDATGAKSKTIVIDNEKKLVFGSINGIDCEPLITVIYSDGNYCCL